MLWDSKEIIQIWRCEKNILHIIFFDRKLSHCHCDSQALVCNTSVMFYENFKIKFTSVHLHFLKYSTFRASVIGKLILLHFSGEWIILCWITSLSLRIKANKNISLSPSAWTSKFSLADYKCKGFLGQWYSKCGPQTSIDTWEVVKNANTRHLPQCH